MNKIFTLLFLFIITFTFSQSPTCSDPTLLCGDSFLFQTMTNQSSIGQVGCLNNANNPSWFYFKVGNGGNLVFDIRQGNNYPDFNNLDVDYICWGPFTSVPNCDTDLYSYNGNTSISNNIVSCSYSPSSTEILDIPNAIANSYYILLVTNYSNNLGSLKIEQTNVNDVSAGNLNCTIICNVSLGPDRVICNSSTNNINLTANFDPTSEVTPNNVEYEWYFNGVLQSELTTQTVSVNQSGIWKVIVNGYCFSIVEDEVSIIIDSNEINSNPIILNGQPGECSPVFDLTQSESVFLNGINQSDYDFVYFDENFDLISNPESFSISENTSVFVYFTNINSGCSYDSFLSLDIDCPASEITIVSQPNNQSFNIGESRTFTTSTLNVSSYLWQRSTNGGISWINLVNGGVSPVISGINTSTLILDNLPSTYDGSLFRVQMASTTDLKYSESALLSIALANPDFETFDYVIYPNPIVDQFKIQLEENLLFKNPKYSIIDLNGRKILEGNIVENVSIISVETLQSGIYLIEISTNDSKNIKKIIKN